MGHSPQEVGFTPPQPDQQPTIDPRFIFVPFAEQQGSKIHRIQLAVEPDIFILTPTDRQLNLRGLYREVQEYTIPWGDNPRLECVVPDVPMIIENHNGKEVLMIDSQYALPIIKRTRGIREFLEFGKPEDEKKLEAEFQEDDMEKIREMRAAIVEELAQRNR